jgi:RNA polymerase sigma factor (TIGR02999 family)
MADVTQILAQIDQGDSAAAAQLLPLVYNELRQLAAARLSHEKPGHTLQATALVHEAYLRLVGDGDAHWKSRAHFFGAAAEAMRRILVEAARRKGRHKRGGGWERCDLDAAAAVVGEPTVDLVALDEALTELDQREPAKAELVKLRFFAGLTLDEAAAALGISSATADRHWKFARAWLANRLRDESRASPAEAPKDND